MNEQDRGLEAFHRLLADGSVGGQAKVDALVALAQRTVLVPTWATDDESFRTLVNAEGLTALPIFTNGVLLQAAAARFGWVNSDGSVPHREVGSRAALRHAIAQNLPFVVVDIASPHSLEIERTEIAPLLTPEAGRESQGPFAGVGRVSSSMLQAVKPTPAPGSAGGPSSNPRPRSATPPIGTPPPAGPARPPSVPHARAPTPTPRDSGGAAHASQPAPASEEWDDANDDLSKTGTRERPRPSTPLAHVLGERRRTPRHGNDRVTPPPSTTAGATRESARPPPMDASGSYGAAARAQRRQLEGRTPPSGGIRTPFAQRSSTPAANPPAEPPRASRPSQAAGLRSDVPPGMGGAPGAAGQQPARITPLGQDPPDPLLDAATVLLRGYPEVEWASFCHVARGDGGPMAAIALRIDEGFRQRIGEIVLGLRTAGAQSGSDVDVVLLDDPDTTRAARTEGVVFYPWRRAPSRPGT